MRQGLLSHGSFLALGARGDETSPTLRGKAVRTRLLCEAIPPPPPGVVADVAPPVTKDAVCKKDRYAEHAANPNCAGCHKLTDAVGFGLENFDGRGRFRAKENTSADCPIEGEGELVGIGKFRGPGELADLVLVYDGLTTCVTTQAYRFLAGHTDLDATDKRVVEVLARARPSDFRLDELLVDMVAQPYFLSRIAATR
jgi:hypothetical protein